MADPATPDPSPTPEAPSHGITVEQYRAALQALGLDPDRTVSVTLGGAFATVTTVELDTDGAPVVELGVLATTTRSGPLVQPGD